jgi:hypothetical protein
MVRRAFAIRCGSSLPRAANHYLTRPAVAVRALRIKTSVSGVHERIGMR